MRNVFLRRAMLAVMTVVAGGLISATLARYAPGFGTDERQLDARLSGDSIAAIRRLNSEERSVFTYYANSLWRAMHGDLGTSRSLNRPVRQLLAERSTVTLRIAGEGLAVAWIAASLAVLATWIFRAPALAGSITLFEGTLLCLPAAVMALLFILLNAPAYLALALIVFPKVHRYLGDLVSDARQMPHIITAQAKGISELRVLFWKESRSYECCSGTSYQSSNVRPWRWQACPSVSRSVPPSRSKRSAASRALDSWHGNLRWRATFRC